MGKTHPTQFQLEAAMSYANIIKIDEQKRGKKRSTLYG
jgi:hypothetical protein